TLAAREIGPSPAWVWVEKIIWITLAMVGARSAAMALNRIADRRIAAANTRNAGRALPPGLADARLACIFTCMSRALCVRAAGRINGLALVLSPVALASVFVYSYTKRFTAASPLFLGWCLAIAPAGAWIAIQGRLTAIALLLSLCVMLWTAGFDILYACQDF